MNNWRNYLYQKYITTGQASVSHPEAIKSFENQKPYIQKCIKKYFLNVKKDEKIIDLGCGRGSFVYYLSRAGFSNVIGVDISYEQVEVARKASLKNIFQDDISVFLKKQEPESASIIILFDIIEHLNKEELFSLISEVIRILKKNGKILIHAPNAQGVFGNSIRYGDLTHELAFTALSIKQLFQCFGCVSVLVYEDYPTVHNFFSFIRKCIYIFFTLPFRLIDFSETGVWGRPMSSNILAVIHK